MKCWDIGGQAQYRSEWGRYTRGCDVIVYVVDAHAEEKVNFYMIRFGFRETNQKWANRLGYVFARLHQPQGTEKRFPPRP